MKSRRASIGSLHCSESAEKESTPKRPRGRPCKRRFHATDFSLKPKGEDGGPKRTPLHIGDPFAKEEHYEVETVLAACMKRGIEHFKVLFPIFTSRVY